MKKPTSLNNFLKAIKPLKRRLRMVALFGSYARGDYDRNSDIDILVVANSHDDKIREKIIELVDESMEATDYEEMLSPIIMDVRHFEKIKNNNTDLFYFLHKEGEILWQAKN
jgi:predicted nucleotidyltransferase